MQAGMHTSRAGSVTSRIASVVRGIGDGSARGGRADAARSGPQGVGGDGRGLLGLDRHRVLGVPLAAGGPA